MKERSELKENPIREAVETAAAIYKSLREVQLMDSHTKDVETSDIPELKKRLGEKDEQAHDKLNKALDKVEEHFPYVSSRRLLMLANYFPLSTDHSLFVDSVANVWMKKLRGENLDRWEDESLFRLERLGIRSIELDLLFLGKIASSQN